MIQDDWSYEWGHGPWLRLETQTPSDPVLNEVRLTFIESDGHPGEAVAIHVPDEDVATLARILKRYRKAEGT